MEKNKKWNLRSRINKGLEIPRVYNVALEKLDEIEKRILELGDDPYIGTDPRYLVLKRQGYKVLILEKDLVFYKIDEEKKTVVVYAVVDQRQDYLNIIRGL